jgi:CheY-like chemotaxis protein
MMPEKDGIETLAELKKLKNTPNIKTPIICLTANAVSGMREMYLGEGFDDYLTKPIDSTYLEMMLKKYIPSDKIEVVTEEELINAEKAAQNAEDDHDTIFRFLGDNGINVSKGLSNCAGDEEFYLSMLKEYLKGSEDKKNNLKKFRDSGDFKNYSILIHSIKSTSATIGAMAPYKIAQELEAASKEEKRDFVATFHEIFMKEYDSMLETLRSVLPVDDTDDSSVDFSDENGVMEFSPDPE